MSEDETSDRLLQCLVEHKNDAKFGTECHLVVEHHQRIRSKDLSLSPLFKRACQQDVDHLCLNWKPEKDDEESVETDGTH